MKMTRYLWTGESEYCICAHHVTDHETCQSFIAIATQEPPTVICRGKFGNKSHPISHCNCDEFRPYRIRILGEDDNEVIEQQYSEVKNIQWVQYCADNVTNRSPLIISISVKELAKRYRWI